MRVCSEWCCSVSADSADDQGGLGFDPQQIDSALPRLVKPERGSISLLMDIRYQLSSLAGRGQASKAWHQIIGDVW